MKSVGDGLWYMNLKMNLEIEALWLRQVNQIY